MAAHRIPGVCLECGPVELELEGRETTCPECGRTAHETAETRGERIEREHRQRAGQRLTVADLREALEGLDGGTPVHVTLGGAFDQADDAAAEVVEYNNGIAETALVIR